MKRLIFALVAAIAAVILLWSAASAFTPPNNRHIQYIEYNQVAANVANDGVLGWRAVDSYGWSQWRSIVARSMDTGSDYAQSLGNGLAYYTAQYPGNVYGGGITVREDTANPDVDVIAVPTAFLEAKCGSGFAVACAYLLNPRPAPTYFKAATMILYVFTGQSAVIQHEVYHVVAHACDQYRGGCPPTDNEPFTCTSNPDTLMDCNLASRFVTWYDYETFRQLYTPPPLTGVRFEAATNRILWGTPGRFTSRVAVIYWDYITNQTGWVDTVGAGVQSLGILRRPNSCFYAEAQSAVMPSYTNYVFVPDACT